MSTHRSSVEGTINWRNSTTFNSVRCTMRNFLRELERLLLICWKWFDNVECFHLWNSENCSHIEIEFIPIRLFINGFSNRSEYKSWIEGLEVSTFVLLQWVILRCTAVHRHSNNRRCIHWNCSILQWNVSFEAGHVEFLYSIKNKFFWIKWISIKWTDVRSRHWLTVAADRPSQHLLEDVI